MTALSNGLVPLPPLKGKTIQFLPRSMIEGYLLTNSTRDLARATGDPKSTVWYQVTKEAKNAPSGIELSAALKRRMPWGENSGSVKVLALDAGYFGHWKKKRGRKAGRAFVYTHIVDLRTHDPLAYLVARAPDSSRREGNVTKDTPYTRQLKRVLRKVRDVLGYTPTVVVSDLDKSLMKVVSQVFFNGRKGTACGYRFVGCYFHFRKDVYSKLPTRALSTTISNKKHDLRRKMHRLSSEELARIRHEIMSLQSRKRRYEELRTKIAEAVCAESEASRAALVEALRGEMRDEKRKLEKARARKKSSIGHDDASGHGDPRVVSAISFLLKNLRFFPPLEVLRRLEITNLQINTTTGGGREETGPTNNVCENAIGQVRRFWNTRKGFRSVKTFQNMVNFFWSQKRMNPNSTEDGEGSTPFIFTEDYRPPEPPFASLIPVGATLPEVGGLVRIG